MATPRIPGALPGGVRPGMVRARSYRGQVVAMEVYGLRRAEKLPAELRDAYEAMLRRLEINLIESFKSVVPGGPGGRLGKQIAAKRLAGGQIVVGTFGSQFAKALDRGFTATAKKGKALRFEIAGERVFRKRVRVPGQHFFAEAIAEARPIVEATYDAFFYDVRELRFG